MNALPLHTRRRQAPALISRLVIQRSIQPSLRVETGERERFPMGGRATEKRFSVGTTASANDSEGGVASCSVRGACVVSCNIACLASCMMLARSLNKRHEQPLYESATSPGSLRKSAPCADSRGLCHGT